MVVESVSWSRRAVLVLVLQWGKSVIPGNIRKTTFEFSHLIASFCIFLRLFTPYHKYKTR